MASGFSPVQDHIHPPPLAYLRCQQGSQGVRLVNRRERLRCVAFRQKQANTAGGASSAPHPQPPALRAWPGSAWATVRAARGRKYAMTHRSVCDSSAGTPSENTDKYRHIARRDSHHCAPAAGRQTQRSSERRPGEVRGRREAAAGCESEGAAEPHMRGRRRGERTCSGVQCTVHSAQCTSGTVHG